MRALALVPFALAIVFAQDAPKPRNAIIFVADGLRYGSVNPTDTPALYRVRTEGVHFANSHAVFPTQTMPNAAAIATGHYPGDNGQFANQIFVAYPLFDSGNFGQDRGTMVPDVEEGLVIADINDHYGGNFLREASLWLTRDRTATTPRWSARRARRRSRICRRSIRFAVRCATR